MALKSNHLQPVPAKLARLRRAKNQLRVAFDNATERYQTLTSELRTARRELQHLEASPRAYLKGEQTELDKAIDAKRKEIARLEPMLADATAEREEIQADLKPTLRTVQTLERHLGITSNDQFIEADRHSVFIGGSQ